MKKVRCLIGTVGAAVPVFGMVMPAGPGCCRDPFRRAGHKDGIAAACRSHVQQQPGQQPQPSRHHYHQQPSGSQPQPRHRKLHGNEGGAQDPNRFAPVRAERFYEVLV